MTKYSETELEELNIRDFEHRVKMFAFEQNKGYINLHQLREAFKDTQIFDHLDKPNSLKTKFLLSDFVANLPVGSKLDPIVSKTKSQVYQRSY